MSGGWVSNIDGTWTWFWAGQYMDWQVPPLDRQPSPPDPNGDQYSEWARQNFVDVWEEGHLEWDPDAVPPPDWAVNQYGIASGYLEGWTGAWVWVPNNP